MLHNVCFVIIAHVQENVSFQDTFYSLVGFTNFLETQKLGWKCCEG